MSTFLQDLKYSLRLLVKSPGFAAAAMAVLALGIGLNTAMFSIVNALAFSPRPFPEPDRVVQLYTQDEKDPGKFRAFSYSSFRELRERKDVFSGVLAHTMTMVGVGTENGGQTAEDGGQGNRRTFGSLVSANYFETLGVPLLRGRTVTAEEEKPGARIPVVIVSHLYWKKTGFRPDLVGSTVRINDRPFTVIGITPPNFTGTIMLIGPELYFPFGMFDALANDFEGSQQTLEKVDAYNLFLVARLAPGVSRATANAALAGIADGLEKLHPVEHRAQNFIVGDLPRLSTSTNPSNETALKTLSLVMLGLTGAVLLIVCFNLASLLFARGHARRKEFAIRLALGGGRTRIIRQLLTEGVVLALAGGLLGLGLANWSSELLVRALGAHVPVGIFLSAANPAVVLAMLVFCSLATLGFALGPALKFSRPDLLSDLKTQAGEDAPGKRRRWLPRHPLVVAQIALSLGLLVTAGLFVRLALDATNYETGYRADDTVLAEVDASLANYDATRTRETYRVIEERLRAMPGVSVASLGAIVPQGMLNIGRNVRRAGAPMPTDEHKPAIAAEGRAYQARWNAIGAGYFDAMGIPLLRGRAFTDAEAFGSTTPTVVIIDETLAKKLWPDGDALGQRVQWDAESGPRVAAKAGEPLPSMEVVGIARPTRDGYEQREMGNAVYVPFAQGFMSNVHFHVRPAVATPAAARALIDGVRRELQAAAPGVPVFKVTTFREHRDSSIEVWGLRLIGMLFVLFSGLALLIAVIGLYGVKAHAVSRRTREIGIRLALGAEPRAVRNLILHEGLRLTAVGLCLGLAMGAAAGWLMSRLFVSMPAFDPAALLLSSAALLAAASLACWLPARRATKVDPMVALRTE